MPSQIVAAVGILILDSKVLILQRSAQDRAFPNQWSFPGGKMDPGETLEETCVREFYEETGQRVRVRKKVCNVTSAHQVHSLEVDVTSFEVALENDLGPIRLSASEHTKSAWVPLAEIMDWDLAGRSRELLGDLLLQ